LRTDRPLRALTGEFHTIADNDDGGVCRRYEHASAVLTSNQPFEDLGDGVMAAVLIDRLLHHCLIVNSRGSSYGMREHRALASRLVTPPIAAASPPTGRRARQEA